MGAFNSLIRWFLLIVVSVFIVTSLFFMYHIIVSDVDTVVRTTEENRTKRTPFSRLSDDENDPQLHHARQNAHIDYQVHSWDDLNEWEQGINKGVTWFKVDLFYTPSHICAQNRNSNHNDKNNSEKNQKKRACFLMTHDPPDINNPHKYNTTNDLIQMLRSWKQQKKHSNKSNNSNNSNNNNQKNQKNHQKKKKITIALCFKYFLLLDATRYLESRYFVDHRHHHSHRSTPSSSSSNNKKKLEWYLLNRNPCHVPPRFNTLNHDYNQQQQQQQTNHNDDDDDDEEDTMMVDLFPHMMKKMKRQQERSKNNSHDRATAAAVIHLYDHQYHSPYLLAHSSQQQPVAAAAAAAAADIGALHDKYGDDSDEDTTTTTTTTTIDHQFISLIDELYRELNAINDDDDDMDDKNNNNSSNMEQEWEYEFVLDESGTHGNGRDCLKKKWMRWSSTFISTRDPMIAFVSNQPYHHRFKILNEPVMDRTESVMTNDDENDKSTGGGNKAETEEDESSSEDDDNCKYLRRAQALRYGKFLHGEYPVLLWEPSHQAVIQQCIQLYLTGHDNDHPSSRNQRQRMSNIDKGSRAQSSSAVVLNDSGLRFSINIDPIMFRIFMSYYYPAANKYQTDNDIDSNSLPSLLPSDGNNSGSNHHHQTISVIDNPEYHNQLNHHVPNTHMMVNEPSIQHHIWMTSNDDDDNDDDDGQRQRKSPSTNSDMEKTSSTRRHTLLFSCVVDTLQQPSAAGQSAQLIHKCHYQIISYRSNDSDEDKGIVIHQTPLQPLSLPSSSTNHPTTTTTPLVVKRFISMRHQQQPSTSSSVQPNNHQMYQLYAMIESINGQYFVCELRYNIHTFTVHYQSHYLIQLLNNEERDKMEGRLLWDFYLLPRIESSSQQDILLLSSLQNNNQKNINDDDDGVDGDDTCEITIQLYQLRQDASQAAEPSLKQVGQHTEIHWKLMSESFSIQSMSMALSDRAIMMSSNNQYDGYLIFSVGVNRHGFKQSLVHGLSFHLSIHQSSLSYQLTSDAQDNLIHLSQRVPLSIGRHVSLSSFTTTSTTMTTNMWLTMVWDAGFCWNSVVHNLQATRLCELNPLDVFQSTSTTMRDAAPGKARPDNILAYTLIQLSDLIALQKKHQKVNDHTKRRHVLLSPCDSGTMIHGTFDRGTNPRVQPHYDSTKNVVRFLTSHIGTKGKRTFQYPSPLRKAAAKDPGSPPTDPNLLTSRDVCGAAIAHNGIVIDYWTVLLPY